MREITGPDVARMFGLGFCLPTVCVVLGVITSVLAHSTWFFVAGVTIALLVGAWAIWSFFQNGWTFTDFGFVPLAKPAWHLLWQIPIMIVSALVIAAGIGALFRVEPSAEQNHLESVDPQYAPLMLVVIVLLAVIAGPIWEEVVFRRFLMGWLDYRWNMPALSIVGSSLVFGLVHAMPPVMIWAFLLGTCCAFLVRWYKSLWAGIIFHGFNNLLVTTGTAIAFFS